MDSRLRFRIGRSAGDRDLVFRRVVAYVGHRNGQLPAHWGSGHSIGLFLLAKSNSISDRLLWSSWRFYERPVLLSIADYAARRAFAAYGRNVGVGYYREVFESSLSEVLGTKILFRPDGVTFRYGVDDDLSSFCDGAPIGADVGSVCVAPISRKPFTTSRVDTGLAPA